MLGQYSAKSSVAGSAITSFAIPSGGSAIASCIEVDSSVAALAGRRRADLQVVERGTTGQRKEADIALGPGFTVYSTGTVLSIWQ